MTYALLCSLVACALVSGCAAQLVSVNEKTIVVQARRSDVAGATDIAEAQCQRRGLHARLVTKPAENQFGFECVR